MNIDQKEIFCGKKVQIVEMILSNKEQHLELSWKIDLEGTIYIVTFYNVSRLRMNNLSAPLEVYGFEIIDHSQRGWETDSKFEMRDFEDDGVNFYFEYCIIT